MHTIELSTGYLMGTKEGRPVEVAVIEGLEGDFFLEFEGERRICHRSVRTVADAKGEARQYFGVVVIGFEPD